MTPPTPEFENVSREAQATCSDWSSSRRLLGILDDDLKVGQQFRDKSQCITVVKWWHIKNRLQYKVHRSTKTLVNLQCFQEPACRWSLRGVYQQKYGC